MSEDAKTLDTDAKESIKRAKGLSVNAEKIAKKAENTLQAANKINKEAKNLKTEVINNMLYNISLKEEYFYGKHITGIRFKKL